MGETEEEIEVNSISEEELITATARVSKSYARQCDSRIVELLLKKKKTERGKREGGWVHAAQ